MLGAKARQPFAKAVADVTALADRIDGVVARLAAYEVKNASADQKAKIAAVTEELTKYKGAIEWVTSMLEIDFASAVSFLAPFDGNYKRMTGIVAGPVDDVVVSTKAEANRGAEAAGTANTMLLAGSVAGLIISIFVAGLVAVGTSRSIGHVAAATSAAAKGEGVEGVDIDVLERGDELGAIVVSLRTFKENILRIAIMQQQNGATREISGNIQEAATGARQAAANVDSVTRKAAETGDSVSRVTSLGETLFTQSELLKETVGRVVENLRAAA